MSDSSNLGDGEKRKSIRSYRDLVAWQRAFEFGAAVHAIARTLPAEEKFGLTAQLRRGAISVASNIAEGYGRGSKGDYARFLKVARGSLYEIDTQLLFAQRFGYITADAYEKIHTLREECERILAGLIRSIDI